MTYVKQTWKTGDVITQEKLNHMEDGIASAGSGSSGSLFADVTKLRDEVSTALNPSENADNVDFYETDTELSDIAEKIGIRVSDPFIGTVTHIFNVNMGIRRLYPGDSRADFYLANECQAVVCGTDNGFAAIVRTGTATINEGGGGDS